MIRLKPFLMSWLPAEGVRGKFPGLVETVLKAGGKPAGRDAGMQAEADPARRLRNNPILSEQKPKALSSLKPEKGLKGEVCIPTQERGNESKVASPLLLTFQGNE